MKQFNDITIIGIDQGYGNMKTANTIFPTAITAYDTAPMFKGDVLEYGGKFYRVGEGHKGFVADKSTDGDFYLLTLAAIAKELEQYRLFTASLCLSVGLPLSWVGSQRESFRQYLMQNETIRFRFNGNLFQLRIVGCKVYPQGYAAIVQQLADFEGEHLLADIGNGTMNLLYLTDAVNRTLEEKQQSVRVTHLSHAALGLDEQPTVHEGSQARNLELQGIKADRCELNRQIRADNKLLRELKAQLAKLSKAVENTVEHIAETLERLRSSLIMLQYRLLVNNKQVDTWKRQVNYYRPILQDYHAVTQQLADKKSEQEQLQTTRNTASLLQIAQRRQLAEQIAALTEKIEELRSRQAMILHNLDCKNNGEAQRFGSYLDKLEEMQEKLAAQRESLTQQLSATIKQYLEIENMIQPEDEDSVRQRRTALRPDVAFEREQQLSHNGYIDNISIQIARQIVDVQIVGDKISEKVQTSMAQHKEVPDR